VVELWGLRLGERLLVATVMSPSAQAGVAARGNVNYKHMLEVWLDTLRDEYERESARSPLERCVLFGENRFLDTCFTFSGDGEGLSVTSSNVSVSPLFRVPLHQGLFDIGGVQTLSAQTAATRTRALETVTSTGIPRAAAIRCPAITAIRRCRAESIRRFRTMSMRPFRAGCASACRSCSAADGCW